MSYLPSSSKSDHSSLSISLHLHLHPILRQDGPSASASEPHRSNPTSIPRKTYCALVPARIRALLDRQTARQDRAFSCSVLSQATGEGRQAWQGIRSRSPQTDSEAGCVWDGVWCCSACGAEGDVRAGKESCGSRGCRANTSCFVLRASWRSSTSAATVRCGAGGAVLELPSESISGISQSLDA